MQKIILSLAFVFVMFSFTEANTNLEKMNTETIAIEEVNSSNCAKFAIEVAELLDELYSLTEEEFFTVSVLAFESCAGGE